MTSRPKLRALADAAGILSSYVDQGGVTRHTADDTRVRLLGAMDLDASTEEAAGRTLAGLRSRRDGTLPNVAVMAAADARRLTVHTSHRDDGKSWEWEIEVEEEGGSHSRTSGRTQSRDGVLSLRLPVRLPDGYHRVRLQSKKPGATPTVA